MSKEPDSGIEAEELHHKDESTVEQTPVESEELQDLMQSESSSEQVGRLNDEALAAAEQAVAAEESGLHGIPQEGPDPEDERIGELLEGAYRDVPHPE